MRNRQISALSSKPRTPDCRGQRRPKSSAAPAKGGHLGSGRLVEAGLQTWLVLPPADSRMSRGPALPAHLFLSVQEMDPQWMDDG